MAPLKISRGKPGSAPGVLRAPTTQRVESVTIEVMHYDVEHLHEPAAATVEEALACRERAGVTWINVVGVHNLEVVQRLGDAFGLHPLALEDVVNVHQRPKTETYEGHEFIVLHHVHVDTGTATEQISMFLGSDFVITFQEIPADSFDPVRERIRHGRGRIRKLGADYLAYALIDAIVDHYFPVLEAFGARLEELEEELVKELSQETLGRIHGMKKELLILRRSAWPQREVVSSLERLESELIQPGTRIFLRDCYDHAIQILDLVETYRDLTGGMLDIYLSSVSNRMNEVMKVLTIMASLFIPLTFIAGVYGMNFNPDASPWNMPELNWRWGYPAFWGVMVVVGGAMIAYFRRRKWL